MTREEFEAILGFSPSDEQWQAISAPLDSPLLVLAGAGSGKTAVMSARVLWLVGSGQVAPEQVLGLTFTRKAAHELGSRIRSLLSQVPTQQTDAAEPTIATYHSFAMDLLAEYGLLVGAEPAATLLHPVDLAVATYRSVVDTSLPCENLGTSNLADLCQKIQNLDEQMSEHIVDSQRLREHDEMFIAMLSGQKQIKAVQAMVQAAQRRIIASRVVEEVRASRHADAAVSFSDLMRHAVEISEVPRVRAELRERYAVVLLDEYQDTSVAQALMLHNLFGEGFPLTAVGDPLQAIYGWRGASVANIDSFPASFSAKTTSLSINRRSGSLILDVANEVASDVRSQHPGVKVLRPAGAQPGTVEAALFASWDDEATWLVRRVREQVDAGHPPDEIAVLCRTNRYVEDLAVRLRAEGVPAAAASLGSVIHLPEVAEVLATLRVLHDADNAALVRLLTGPQWRIGPSDLAVLGQRARELAGFTKTDDDVEFDEQLAQAVAKTDPVETVSLLEAVYDPGRAISGQARERLREFAGQLDAMRSALILGVDEAAHRIVEVSGLGVEVRLGAAAEARVDGLAALFDLIAEFRSSHMDASVPAFLLWLDRAEHLDAMPDAEFPVRGRAVQVMTVHRAKGLEWDCVYVPGLSADTFPSSNGTYVWTTHFEELPYPLRGDAGSLPVLPGWTASGGTFTESVTKVCDALKEQYKQQDAWEENRLAYVALTRARKQLVTTGHWWSKDAKLKGPSPYLETIRTVPGVSVDTWIDQAPAMPAGLEPGDMAWPSPGEVFTDIEAPVGAAAELTSAEQDLLAQLDADISAVIERETEQSMPVDHVDLPQVLSTSLLMRAAANPELLALDLARPMPRVTGAAARRGTAFHEWVAANNEQLSLIPDWETAKDEELADDADLADLIAGYRRTEYSQMTPYATETEVAISLAGVVVRGVIDAVFQHPDGTWEVVDWKTSRDHAADPLQLAVYRLAWAQRMGVDPNQVRTAFVYVADGDVVRPELPDRQELELALAALQ